MYTLVVEGPVHLLANVVAVHNPVAALDNQAVDVGSSGIRRPAHALILTFALSASTNLYIPHVVTMVVYRLFVPETNLWMMVAAPLDTDRVEVVRDPMAVTRLANEAAEDHASHSAVVEVLHNILLVARLMGLDHLVEYQLRNVALVAVVVVDIAGIDQRVVEVSIVIPTWKFLHRLASTACSFFLPAQEM